MPESAAPAADPSQAALQARIGGSPGADPYGPQTLFPAVPAERLAAGFVAALTDIGVLGVEGEEAAKFLHAQLTNDVEHLGAGEARWYGYCSPKGRLLATFIGWRDAERVLLGLARPRAEPIRKRLAMFVLRTKARVVDCSESLRVLGLGGADGTAALAALGLPAPAPLEVARADGLACVGMPAIHVDGRPCARWMLVADDSRLEACWSTLAGRLTPVSSTVWRWTEVLAAVPRIVDATAELFVPQMLNFEVVGGVNFKKGCYPGQEVVARSQYLGKLKRRMFVAHLEGDEPAPASDVYPASGGQPCGQVVLAAPSPTGGVDLLFESQTAALDAGAPTIGGTPVSLRELPYEMPA